MLLQIRASGYQGKVHGFAEVSGALDLEVRDSGLDSGAKLG